MVYVTVASLLDEDSYNSKGAAATGGGGGNVGQEVVGWLSSMPLRQCSSGSYPKINVV